MIDFQTHPANYQHWSLSVDTMRNADSNAKVPITIATLTLNVNPDGGLLSGYELKLNSYDLGVDIELFDAVQRLRFEHPQVATVVITSGQDKTFCAGANIRMLGQASHGHKVNFCKFTNETRLAIEDACRHSGQRYLCAINGTAAGGGYELALACEHLLLIDDGASAVSLPEVPLLAVLPATGGLTRLTDKRKVRPDHADFFCTTEEGVRGERALRWRLVDEIAPASKFVERVRERAAALAAPKAALSPQAGIELTPLARELDDAAATISYPHIIATIDRATRSVEITLRGPSDAEIPPANADGDWIQQQGDTLWSLALTRELDDLLLHLRLNEPTLGTWVFKTRGDSKRVLAYDQLLLANSQHWLAREVVLYWKRTLKRLELSARSVIAVIDPGSCFAGSLLDIALGADRSYMLDGQFEDNPLPAATICLGEMNFGPLPKPNGLSRLAARCLAEPERVESLRQLIHQPLAAAEAEAEGLVSFIPDDLDWDDELRLALEARASFSPDALTGLEASLRYPGPETMESKIFARLSAWQNWIFQRPNAVGAGGALTLYGSGKRGEFDQNRI